MSILLSQRTAVCCFVMSVAIGSCIQAADRADRRRTEEARQVELFAAMKEGEIEVQFIPKDSRSANVLIRNKSGKPLSVKLPATFAGVPVLAQMGAPAGGGGGPGGFGAGGGGGFGGGGGGQGMGGGFGGGGGMMGGMGGGMGGMGGGMFNVAPDKVGKIMVTTVCLEHGKPEPSPRMKYEIRPIDALTKDARVVELCRMVGSGEVPQNAAQAAAWTFTDGLSWRELAAKDRFRSQFTGHVEKYFTPAELQLATHIAMVASNRANQNKQPSSDTTIAGDQVSPGESQGFAGGR